MKKRLYIVNAYPFIFDPLNKNYALTVYNTTLNEAFEVMGFYRNKGFLCTLKQIVREVA